MIIVEASEPKARELSLLIAMLLKMLLIMLAAVVEVPFVQFVKISKFRSDSGPVKRFARPLSS